MTGPSGQPYLRMFGQLRGSTQQRLWPDFRREATTDWLGPLDDVLDLLPDRTAPDPRFTAGGAPL